MNYLQAEARILPEEPWRGVKGEVKERGGILEESGEDGVIIFVGKVAFAYLHVALLKPLDEASMMIYPPPWFFLSLMQFLVKRMAADAISYVALHCHWRDLNSPNPCHALAIRRMAMWRREKKAGDTWFQAVKFLFWS